MYFANHSSKERNKVSFTTEWKYTKSLWTWYLVVFLWCYMTLSWLTFDLRVHTYLSVIISFICQVTARNCEWWFSCASQIHFTLFLCSSSKIFIVFLCLGLLFLADYSIAWHWYPRLITSVLQNPSLKKCHIETERHDRFFLKWNLTV